MPARACSLGQLFIMRLTLSHILPRFYTLIILRPLDVLQVVLLIQFCIQVIICALEFEYNRAFRGMFRIFYSVKLLILLGVGTAIHRSGRVQIVRVLSLVSFH